METASKVVSIASVKPVVKKSLKSFLPNLKKSVLVDWVSPSEIKGIKKSTELLNRLSSPLSEGVRNFGLVKTGISKKEMPFVKKLVKVYTPADLKPDLFFNLLRLRDKAIGD
jgi:hypothetical protein